MGELGDILHEAAETAINGMSAAAKEVGKAVSQGSPEMSTTIENATQAFVNAATENSKGARYPYDLTVKCSKINWLEALTAQSDDEIYIYEPNRSNNIYRLITQDARPLSLIEFDKPFFLGHRGDVTNINILDMNFYFSIDWRNTGVLYRVGDLLIIMPKNKEIIIKSEGEDEVHIQLKLNSAKVWYRDKRFVSLALSVAFAALASKKM